MRLRRTPHPPRPASPAAGRRVSWQLIAMGLVMLIGGLSLAVASVRHRMYLAEKADRLRDDGREVTAWVMDGHLLGGRAPGRITTNVRYEYEGRQYHAEIRCGGSVGCGGRPDAEFTIWVDPERPTEFVADNGRTDDAVTYLDSWKAIPGGIGFTILGALSLGFGVTFVWQDQRERRRSRRAEGAGTT